MTDKLDYTKLREVAEAATEGPWSSIGRSGKRTMIVWLPENRGFAEGVAATRHNAKYEIRNRDNEQRRNDAAFIATFDPPTALSLLEEIANWKYWYSMSGAAGDRLEAENKELKARLNAPFPPVTKRIPL